MRFKPSTNPRARVSFAAQGGFMSYLQDATAALGMWSCRSTLRCLHTGRTITGTRTDGRSDAPVRCITDQEGTGPGQDRTRTGRRQDEAVLSNRKCLTSPQVFPRAPDRNPTIPSKLRIEFPAFPALVTDDPASTDTTTFLQQHPHPAKVASLRSRRPVLPNHKPEAQRGPGGC